MVTGNKRPKTTAEDAVLDLRCFQMIMKAWNAQSMVT